MADEYGKREADWKETVKNLSEANSEKIKEIDNLRRGYSATGVESWPCPGCKWDAGKLLGLCGLHQQIDHLRREIAALKNRLGDNLCHLENPDTDAIPPKAEFLKSCERFWEQRSSVGVLKGCQTIAQLEEEIVALKAEVERLKGDYLRGREAEQLARDTVHVPHIEQLQAEIAALKAKLGEAEKREMTNAEWCVLSQIFNANNQYLPFEQSYRINEVLKQHLAYSHRAELEKKP